jgi:hypothetical protein
MNIGYIYGYRERSTGRWLYVGQSLDSVKRDKGHRKGGRSEFDRIYSVVGQDAIEGPVILETVNGIDRKDLSVNLHWQETIWMIRLRTYRWAFDGRGFNRGLPWGSDYESIGRFGALNQSREARLRAASSGARRRNELYGNPGTTESRSKGGSTNKFRNHKNGPIQIGRLRDTNPEKYREVQTTSARIGTHIFWHASRGIVNPHCDLCLRTRIIPTARVLKPQDLVAFIETFRLPTPASTTLKKKIIIHGCLGLSDLK